MPKSYKSQAQRAASTGAKRASGKTSQNMKSVKKSATKQAGNKSQPSEQQIPIRVLSSIVLAIAFIVCLIAFFLPEGLLVGFLHNLIHWVIGHSAYIALIPIILYAFVIHAFSGKKPIMMRTICLFSFVLICGCISHLSLNPQNLPSGAALIAELAIGGVEGKAEVYYVAALLC